MGGGLNIFAAWAPARGRYAPSAGDARLLSVSVQDVPQARRPKAAEIRGLCLASCESAVARKNKQDVRHLTPGRGSMARHRPRSARAVARFPFPRFPGPATGGSADPGPMPGVDPKLRMPQQLYAREAPWPLAGFAGQCARLGQGFCVQKTLAFLDGVVRIA